MGCVGLDICTVATRKLQYCIVVILKLFNIQSFSYFMLSVQYTNMLCVVCSLN